MRFPFGFLGLVADKPLFQQCDGAAEVVANLDEQIDVVEVSLAAETTGEVDLGVDGCVEFAAVGAEEAEVALNVFGGRRFVSQGGDGDGGSKGDDGLFEVLRSICRPEQVFEVPARTGD